MTEEIKEILDDMKSIPSDEICGLGLGEKQCKLLLNYITNLQKELEKKNAYIKYLEEYNPKYYKGKIFYGDGREDYKQRNEKAIEKINNIFFVLSSNNKNYNNLYIKLVDTEQGKDLLNTLQGGDE